MKVRDMADAARHEEDVIHQVRWLPSAWARIEQAAEYLTGRDHVKTNPVDTIRTGTLRYVDEVLSERDSALKAS